MPMDYSSVYPELNGYFVKPLLTDPPMCSLKELQDGTYTLYDLEVFHQIIEIKQHMKPPPRPNGG